MINYMNYMMNYIIHITNGTLISCPYSDEEKREKGDTIIENLTLTETEELEKKTRYQSKDRGFMQEGTALQGQSVVVF